MYIPYLGGRANYAGFLDNLFEVITQRVVSESETGDELLNKRLLAIGTYVFGFNVLRKNISSIRSVEKQNISSNIQQFLDATGLVTSKMMDDLVNQMTTTKSEGDAMEILKNFFIEMKKSGDGSKCLGGK